MDKQEIPVNPSVLKWARYKAGLSLDEVALLGKIRPLKATKTHPQLSAGDRIEAWEDGHLPITWNQLEALAKVYRRPAVTFFLSAPPLEDAIFPDFRTIGDTKIQKKTPEFSALLRRMYRLHEELVDLLKQEDQERLDFIGSVKLTYSAQDVVNLIRRLLHFSFEDQQRIKSSTDLLRILRDRIQEAGVFVLFEGDLGSYHSRISPEEFRGIAICHPVAPMIIVNPNDAHAARIFTLLHEFSHLLLGETAVSNFDSLRINGNFGGEIELFCNMIAAEFLVPKLLCIELFRKNVGVDWRQKIEDLAKFFKVSRIVVARRLFDCECISREDYWQYFAVLKKQWERMKAKQSEDTGGPSKNVIDKFRLGDKLIHAIMSGTSEGLLSLQEASRLLQVKVSRFDAISS